MCILSLDSKEVQNDLFDWKELRQMNERERLVELLSNAKKYATNIMLHLNIDEAEKVLESY